MTINELKGFFKEHLVPDKFYALNKAKNNKICIEHDGTGWNVFYADRKDKIGLLHFTSEALACKYMVEQVEKLMQIAYGLSFVNHAA